MRSTSEFSDVQLKHLEFLQAVITRHGNASFFIKGWTLTLMTAVFGLSLADVDWKVPPVVLVPLLGFWMLDSYYVWQERIFRRLYDAVRAPGSEVEALSMETKAYTSWVSFSRTAGSLTVAGFYGVLLVVAVFVVTTDLVT